MISPAASRGLAITNPLVLYRSLLATKRIDADPAQYRLAIHLQKVYNELKDYSPEIEYRRQLDDIARVLGTSRENGSTDAAPEQPKGFMAQLRQERANAEAMALTKSMTSHELAMNMQSPKGLLIYGEVGTGKSMLVDLLADSLPNQKKRRWHYNTFMLEVFARLDRLQKSRAGSFLADGSNTEENSLLVLARDLAATSPIMFLDEFQLPDRAASKILSNLMTSFFQLGGVLIATSNRMPEELAKASGIEFSPPASSTLGLSSLKRTLLGSAHTNTRDVGGQAQKGDFAAFLDVLKARCTIWEMEGTTDFRRRDSKTSAPSPLLSTGSHNEDVDGEPLNLVPEAESLEEATPVIPPSESQDLPSHYQIDDKDGIDQRPSIFDLLRAATETVPQDSQPTRTWSELHLNVYGRKVTIPKARDGVCMWTFDELCGRLYGPADYISMAATFHTVVITEVPVLHLAQKNEARRFITLLDALYEARCKLLISAAAGPDDIFFPESKSTATETATQNEDGTYAETFAEIYQDQTAPFRPNISSYDGLTSASDREDAYVPPTSNLNEAHHSTRSILANEDADFGPVYGAGRSASSRSYNFDDEDQRMSKSTSRPLDFQDTGRFTGEDEKFAYKRARSRLWEMCSQRWWDRQEAGWWRPLDKAYRTWEDDEDSVTIKVVNDEVVEKVRTLNPEQEKLFRHGASPFRTSTEAPPKIPWTHAWGMMTWGKKAGAWGKGVDGLKERKNEKNED